MSDGVPIEEVADVLGHVPGSRMTAGVYRHPVRPSVSAARDVMDGLFEQSSGQRDRADFRAERPDRAGTR